MPPRSTRARSTRRRSSATAEPAEAFLAALLAARDRDRSPGARELVAFREGDDPDYLELLRERAEASGRLVALERFGRPLLAVAEVGRAPAERARRAALLAARWRAARPIVLPGWARLLVRSERASLALLERTLGALRRPGTLRRFLASRGLAGTPGGRLADPERDLERILLDGEDGLWVKSATLTSPATNASGRIRFSFGAEGDDDASTDLARHRAVAAVARRALPFADALARSRAHVALLERLAGRPVLLTQHIAYWNAPQGGALLHHDAFDEPARTRQRGVCYVQLSGATVWLALSTGDLARHVRAVLDALERGEAPWIADLHFDGKRAALKLARRARDRAFLVRELTSPGCGEFARLVNYSPEFLGLAIDAGHAALLEAGDAILLPNHGYRRTCLHAVWCAGQEPGAALSTALRETAPHRWYTPP